ncbi:unnamed protein product [Knipowitschia caucasica]
MRLLSCVLALCCGSLCVSLAPAVEFNVEDVAKTADFQRDDERARSLGPRKSSQISPMWRRRSVNGEDACVTLEDADSVLQNNTHTVSPVMYA